MKTRSTTLARYYGRTARALTATLAAVALSGALTAAAAPDPGADGQSTEIGYITVGDRTLTADEFFGDSRLSTPAPTSGTVTPRLIDFPQWVQCFTLNDTEMVIKSYTTWWNGLAETKRLKCGDSGFGYKHIRERHEADWQAKLNKITPSGLFPNVSWDDLMSAAAHNALAVPDYTENVAGSKRCYVVKMGFFNQNGVLIDAYNVRTIAATNSDRVITALPIRDGASFCN